MSVPNARHTSLCTTSRVGERGDWCDCCLWSTPSHIRGSATRFFPLWLPWKTSQGALHWTARPLVAFGSYAPGIWGRHPAKNGPTKRGLGCVQTLAVTEDLFCRWQQEVQELAGLLESEYPALLAEVTSHRAIICSLLFQPGNGGFAQMSSR